MKHKPYSLTGVIFCVLAAAATGLLPGIVGRLQANPADEASAAANPAETPVAGAPTAGSQQTPAAAAQPGPGISGMDLLTQVRDKLQAVTSLQCEIQQTAVLSGMKFTATGRYAQSTGNRFRLDYQIFPITAAKRSDAQTGRLDATPTATAADKQTATDKQTGAADTAAQSSMTQVSDGNVLFTYWKNGTDTRVTRRNIKDILDASKDVAVYDSSRAVQDLGLGGLAALVARLQTSMEFSAVRTETVGGTEFHVVTGRWNKTIRQQMFQLPDGAEVIAQEFIPEYVRLYIDASSALPRRIQYLKRSPDPNQKPVQVRPLVTVDLRQIVLNDAVDDSLFVFTAPEGVVEEDLTEQTIQGIRQTVQPAAGAIPGAAPAVNAPAGPASGGK